MIYTPPDNGTLHNWEISVTVTVSGDRGSGFPGCGNQWTVQVGDFLVNGNATTGGFTAAIVNALGSTVGSVPLATTFNIVATWQSKELLIPGVGHARELVGTISINVNGVTATWTPLSNDVNGLLPTPNLSVQGIASFTDGNTGTTGTTSMVVNHITVDGKAPGLQGLMGWASLDMIQDETSTTLGYSAYWDYIDATWTSSGVSGSATIKGYPGDSALTVGPIPSGYTETRFASGAGSLPGSGATGNTWIETTNSDIGSANVLFEPTQPSFTSGNWITLVNVVAEEAINVTTVAQEWPSGTPIAGMPLAVWNGAWNPNGGAQQCDARLNPILPPVSPFNPPNNGSTLAAGVTHTDKNGNGPTALLKATGAGPNPNNSTDPWSSNVKADCFPNGCIGPDVRGDGVSPFPTSPVADDDQHYLYRHHLDARGGAYGSGSQTYNVQSPGQDSPGVVDLWTSPTLLTITRATSYAIEPGTGAANWSTVGSAWSADANVTITQEADGIHFKKTDAVTGAGILYALETAGKRRGFRHFRYLKVRINSPVASTFRLALYTKSDGLSTPGGGQYVEFANQALAAGESVLYLDLARGLDILVTTGTYANNPAAPAIIPSAGNYLTIGPSGPDPLGFWVLGYASAGTEELWQSCYHTANPTISGTAWQDQDVHWIRIDNIAQGVEYVLEEITLTDRTDGKRTPLRVLGDPCPNALYNSVGDGRMPYSGGAASGGTPFPAFVLRILANGRPVAGFPWAYVESGSDVTVDDFVSRFNDTIDGGAGIWTITKNQPSLTPNVAASWLEVVPGSVTQTGFQLRGRARYAARCGNAGTGSAGPTDYQFNQGPPSPGLLPGWNAALGLPVTIRFEPSALFEGIALDGNTRKPITGTVQESYADPPALSTTITDNGSCDDDGYFAIETRAPITSTTVLLAHYLGVSADTSTISSAGWLLSHRNALHLMVYAHPLVPSRVANLATADGAFHRVARTYYSLSGTAVNGQDGLAYWRYDAGSPRAWNAYGWTAAAKIVDANLADDYPDIERRSDGRLYVVFDRQTQAAPRKADTWECFSDDDGLTWSTPVMTIASGQYPRIRCGKDGSILRLAYVDDGTGLGIGTIQGQLQYPGDLSPGTAFTLQKLDNTGHLVNLVIQSGIFDIDHLSETAARWILTVVEVDATSPTEYVSADDGKTWIRNGTATAGTTVGPGGDMTFKAAAVATSNVTPSGSQTVDGTATGDNKIIALTGQTTGAQNGFWVSSSTGAWTRPAWWASGSTQEPGVTFWAVPNGGSNGGKLWYMSNTANVVVDTDTPSFAVVIPPFTLHMQTDTFAAPISSGTFTLSHTPDGADFSLFIDGVRQPDTSDYYTRTGTSVTLGSSVTLSNIVTAVTFRYTYT